MEPDQHVPSAARSRVAHRESQLEEMQASVSARDQERQQQTQGTWLDAAADVHEGRLAFVPLKSALVKPMTLALCAAPQRQLSRAAQLAIQTLMPKIESGLR